MKEITLSSPAMPLKQAAKPVFHFSIGMLANFGEQSVFYRAATLEEKRSKLRAAVAYNLRRGNVGQVRFVAVRAAVAQIVQAMRDGLPARSAFRREWSSVREVSNL